MENSAESPQDPQDSSIKIANPPTTARSTAEKISFGLASLVVAAIAGLVIFSWATERDRPPVLTLQQSGNIRHTNRQFYVPFELSNIGGETAESVQVSAELKVNGEVKETGNVEIDFLARDEKAEGAFVFHQNPEKGELVIRVSSYKKP